jgi:hypothetical protein
MGWLKLYDEFAWDPKVQGLTEVLQRRWVMLLCLRSIDDTCSSSDMDVALAMRITISEAQKTKLAFANRGFLEGDTWGVRHWEERQYDESESARRMRKLRAKRHNVTSPCDAQSDARQIDRQTDREEPPTPPTRGKFSTSIFLLPDWIEPTDWADYEAMRRTIKKPMTPRARQLAIAKLEKLRSDGNDPAAVLQRSIMHSWQGLFPLEDRGKPGANGQHAKPHQTLAEFDAAQASSAERRAHVAEIRRKYEEEFNSEPPSKPA